jgi:putative ABC transport system permease protein
MAGLASDIRFGVRQLARQKRYAALVVVALGLNLGASAGVLGIVRAYLWMPLPYPESDRLASIAFRVPDVPVPAHLGAVDWSGAREVCDLVVSWDIDGFTIVGDDRPLALLGRWINADVMPMFGITPVLGRLFTAADEAERRPVAVISHRVWQTRFHGLADVIGRSITVRATDRPDETEVFTIVGVLPPRFWHLDDRTDILLPLGHLRPPSFVRLKPGVTAAVAAERLTALVRRAGPDVDPRWHATVSPAHAAHVEPVRDLLRAIVLAVGLLMLVGAGNLLFLQMARALSQARAQAVRTALGASRMRLLRQALVEQALLAGGAAIVGLAFAAWLLAALLPAVETQLGRLAPRAAAIDAALAVAVGAAALLVCLACGLMPLLSAAGPRVAARLAGHPAGTMSRRRALVRHAIVGAQVAATFALLAGAGLAVRSAWHLGRIDVGFDPDNVISASLALHQRSYMAVGDRQRLVAGVVDAIGRLPDVEAVGLVAGWPFGWSEGEIVQPSGGPARQPPARAVPYSVNADYFPALRLRLVEGRALARADASGAVQAAVISETLARALWPGRSAIGRELRFAPAADQPAPHGAAAAAPALTVVGVVADVSRSLVEPRVPEVYTSLERSPGLFLFLQVRTRGGGLDLVPALERQVSAIDANLALADVSMLAERVEAEGVRPRFVAAVLASFAALAAGVALVGVYAVSAWIARQRQREAALRLVLGSTPAAVTRLFVGRGSLVVGLGLALGWAGSLWIGRLLAASLHGVGAGDIVTRAAVASGVGLTCLAAVWWPARRATRLDPAQVLRQE